MKQIYFLLLAFVVFGPIPAAMAKTATASIQGTAEGSPIAGQAILEETTAGLKITVTVSNVPPGKHGFHIHEVGSCEDQGNAAGSHFNPNHVAHGDLLKDGVAKAHAGDLGNIEIGPDGTGKLEVYALSLNLSEGPYNVTDKSMILHEKEDDFGQPTGNAGGRIGCGIIKVSE